MRCPVAVVIHMVAIAQGMIVDEDELVGGGAPMIEAGHVQQVHFRSVSD